MDKVPETQTIKVLIADDQRAYASYTADDILEENHNVEVVIIDNLFDAKKYIDEHKPHIVLCDLLIPPNGYLGAIETDDGGNAIALMKEAKNSGALVACKSSWNQSDSPIECDRLSSPLAVREWVAAKCNYLRTGDINTDAQASIDEGNQHVRRLEADARKVQAEYIRKQRIRMDGIGKF